MNWEDPIHEAAVSDTGMRRSNNQDSFAIVRAPTVEGWKRRGHVFMVADGMGAHAVGELASKLATDNIPHNYRKTKDGSPAEAITKAYRDVGAQIHSKAKASRDFEGTGTTCTTLLLLPAGALIAHVGDSRAYRVRQGRIDQLTFDHSLVWELVRRNHLTHEQAERAVPRNVITRSLGPDPTVEVDLEGPLEVEPGDVYVLCSDGLSGPVSDAEIGAFAAHFDPEQATHYLTHLANLRGGLDNVTTVIIRIEPSTSSADRPSLGRRLGHLIGGAFKGKAAEAEVEEHVYASVECPIDAALLNRLAEVVRHGQAAAVDQTWPVDWPAVTKLRKAAEEARARGDLRGTLGKIGELLIVLGTAARLHRKNGHPHAAI